MKKYILLVIFSMLFCHVKAVNWHRVYLSFKGGEPTNKTYCFSSNIPQKLDYFKLAKLWKVLDMKGYKLTSPQDAAYFLEIEYVEDSYGDFDRYKFKFVDHRNKFKPTVYSIECTSKHFATLYLFWGERGIDVRMKWSYTQQMYSKIRIWRTGKEEQFSVDKWYEAYHMIDETDYSDVFYANYLSVSNEGTKTLSNSNTPKEEKKPNVDLPTSVDVDNVNKITNIINESAFAVIIGNEKYQRVSQVSYANNDARIFAEYCRKTLGLPEKNVRVYEDATYGTMIGAISDLKKIARAFKGDINVIFYYAGHGIPNETTKESYLLPIDADGVNTEVCYPLTRLYKELGELEAKKVTVFMDACFSGAERGDGMVVAARGVAIKPKNDQPMGNTIVFSAATGQQAAYPYKEKGHGMFTYYLLKKLQDTKGDVTLGELGQYICDEAAKQAILTNGKEQTPVVLTPMGMNDEWKNWKLR